MADKVRAVLIAGPTASGKSALAMAVAEAFGGVVVNADSMQVYRELRILTSRPSEADEARVPHRLYGFRPAAEPYSVALWLADVARMLREAEDEGALPVIAGGTGLYFSALTEGLSEVPAIPDKVRKHWRAEAQARAAPELHALLAERDPETAARLRPSDTQRIVRALEVVEATGFGLGAWHAKRPPPLLPLRETVPLVLGVEREELYRRCDARFDAMIAAGALDEAARMLSLALPPDRPAMRAVGLPPLLDHLRGLSSLEKAVRQAKIDTRRYAKRQQTWINSTMIAWNAINAKDMKRTKDEICQFMHQRLTGLI